MEGAGVEYPVIGRTHTQAEAAAVCGRGVAVTGTASGSARVPEMADGHVGAPHHFLRRCRSA